MKSSKHSHLHQKSAILFLLIKDHLKAFYFCSLSQNNFKGNNISSTPHSDTVCWMRKRVNRLSDGIKSNESQQDAFFSLFSLRQWKGWKGNLSRRLTTPNFVNEVTKAPTQRSLKQPWKEPREVRALLFFHSNKKSISEANRRRESFIGSTAITIRHLNADSPLPSK